MAKIYIHTDPDPEKNSFIQALNSRSDKGFEKHLEIVSGSDAGSFFKKYYIGYGHKSIADCGSITIHIENVPTHVALAFQHSRLYNGQELSTRYVDRSDVEFTVHTKKLEHIASEWLDHYRSLRKELLSVLPNHYPYDGSVSKSVYDRAIHAYAVDIARYFLPIGIHTNFSWHTTLSHADDYTRLLIHHPEIDVSITANLVRNGLEKTYPSTFKTDSKLFPNLYGLVRDWYFNYPPEVDRNINVGELNFSTVLPSYRIPTSFYSEFKYQLETVLDDRLDVRLPMDIADHLVRYVFTGKIDYGILRDVHRHRSMSVRYYFDPDYGFDNSVFELIAKYLPNAVGKYMDFVNRTYSLYKISGCREINIFPFGHLFYVHIESGLIPIVYFMGLRSSPSVHWRLRQWVGMLYDRFHSDMENPFRSIGVRIHPNIHHTGPYIPRGKQTILKKDEVTDGEEKQAD